MFILEWMSKLEPIWLPILFLISIYYEKENLKWIKKEFFYDENKDLEKKQKRTRTTKKTTQNPGGGSIVEETTETVSPIEEIKGEKL